MKKWFYMSQKSLKYYLFAIDDDQYCTCKNKNYIHKVMFFVLEASPKFDDESNENLIEKLMYFI